MRRAEAMGAAGNQRHYEQCRHRLAAVQQSTSLSCTISPTERLGTHRTARQQEWRFSGADRSRDEADGVSKGVAQIKNGVGCQQVAEPVVRLVVGQRAGKAFTDVFFLSDNHDNQNIKEKGNSKKEGKPDKDKRFSDVRCQDFVVRVFPLSGILIQRR